MKEKNVYTRRFTATGQVEMGPGIVYTVIVSSDGQGRTSVTFYDGVDTSGINKGVFRSLANRTGDVQFPYGDKFNKGLYIVVGDNCDGVILSIEKLNL